MYLRSLRVRLLFLAGLASVSAILVPLAVGQDEAQGVGACAARPDGALRVDLSGEGCRPNEDPIRLAQPRTAYSNAVSTPVDLGEDTETVVNTLVMDEEGPFVIVGKAFFESPETGGTVSCKGVGSVKWGIPGDNGVILPFQSTEPAESGIVHLVCKDEPGEDIVVRESVLTAIPVDALVLTTG
jgi:hypothetical protein